MVPGNSFDITTGVDLLEVEGRATVWAHLEHHMPRVLVTSAPCTMFSGVMRTNLNRMDPATTATRWEQTNVLLDFSMERCRYQFDHGRFFLHENPLTASSWRRPSVMALADLPGVCQSDFDQCRFGLRAPATRRPLRKATRLLHNIPDIEKVFGNCRCNCTMLHDRIEGSQAGVRLSQYCQVYGPELSHAMVQCFHRALIPHGERRGSES